MQLADLTLTREASKKEREEDVRNLTVADFSKAFWRWYERSKKSVAITGDCVEKT